MVDLVKWSLISLYFTGRLTGSINFEIDFRTARLKVTKRATVCAACLQILILGSLYYQLLHTDFITTIISGVETLTDYVFLVIECSRVIGIILALVSVWTHHRTFVRLYNSFRRLSQNNPEAVQYCRKSIVGKCLCIHVSEILQVVVIFYILRDQLTIPRCIRVGNIVALSVVINVVTAQYFIALATLRGRYFLLNRDLRTFLAETRALNPRKRGVFVTACCSLADRLERIAQSQSAVQGLVERLVRTFQVRIVFIIILSYLNLVGNLYILYSYYKNGILAKLWLSEEVVFVTSFTVYYFIESWTNVYNSFYLLDAHEEMVQLLGQRTLFKPELDQRLEAVIDSFVLNLARNPLRIRFLGFYTNSRPASIALFETYLSHLILLIQYDIEHS
ncbi:putative gustatory receptor 59d [Drosophila biarmipes]|uniref:putative gustatory receptor 59d n=1 Tax=Drosophila biarmipes TaxID=125945 RepID=UPI001CDB4132|nr:putative gustatory receptor 59d [Drosophila biarmipes]